MRQYQLIQHSLDEVEARLVTDRDLTDVEEAALVGVIREALGHPFAVRISREPGPLATGAAGKFEEFVCRVE